MRFSAIIAGAMFIAAVSADSDDRDNRRNPFSPIPGYPLGNGICVTDDQATFIVNNFKSILTNPNRTAAAVTAGYQMADSYVETSDSINILAGYPLGGPSFNGKTAFIQGVAGAPAIPKMTTFDIFHDCTRISWRWQVDGLGRATYPVKGINNFYVAPLTGLINKGFIEFNSFAWGVDIGGSCTAPPPFP